MLIYRVENPANGFGPNGMAAYLPKDRWAAGRLFNGNRKFPSPFSDQHRVGDRPVNMEYELWDPAPRGDVCGAASLHNLREWFDKDDRMFLSQFGFVARVFDVPDDKCSILRHQVCFDRADAHLVETLDIVSLHPICADETQPLLEKAA